MTDVIHIATVSQSNNGHGMTRDTLPDDLRDFDYSGIYIRSNDNPWWGKIEPGVNTGSEKQPQAWGWELKLVQEIREANPDAIILVTKSWQGENSLAMNPAGRDISPRSTGELFDWTTARIDKAIQEGWPPPSVIYYMQGETDATRADWSAAYEDNLTEAFTAMRARWMHDDDGQIVFGRIGTEPWLYDAGVRTGQWAVDQADPNAQSFKTIGFQYGDDGHLLAGGYLEVGQSMFDATVW